MLSKLILIGIGFVLLFGHLWFSLTDGDGVLGESEEEKAFLVTEAEKDSDGVGSNPAPD